MSQKTALGDLPNLNYAWAGLLIEELVRCGVTCFCIAPGSRSSALTLSAARHPKTETVIHYDERGLAFYALGRVAITQKPIALICSSGTAAVNFFPAVVETSKKKLPLILLTADRPPELRHTGAHQTIDQVKLYGNYVRWHMDLPAPTKDIQPEFILTTVDQAVFFSRNPLGGPVHINCMFREPLAPDSDGVDVRSYLTPLKNWEKSQEVYTRYTPGSPRPDFSDDKKLVSVLNNAKRGIIVVGKLASRNEQQIVIDLAEKLNWPLFPDGVSGLRFGGHASGHIIHYFDQVLLAREQLAKFPIDTVLHLGGRITSKRWYQFIQKQRHENHIKNYIAALSHSLRNDPLNIVTQRVKSSVLDFAESILPAVKQSAQSDHLEFLKKASIKAGEIIDQFLENHPEVNEIGVARVISRHLNENHGLFLSNSMPIREIDMYGDPASSPAFIGGNRGASGIDGVIATACGSARASRLTTTLLIGDLAFLHDLNSLALLKSLQKPLIIVVINNDGGGIFSFLPIAQSPDAADLFDSYFGTPHGLECSGAAAMFGLEYTAPTSMEEFEKAYKDALKGNRSTIIEVKTGRNVNYAMHLELQEEIRDFEF